MKKKEKMANEEMSMIKINSNTMKYSMKEESDENDK